MSKESLKAQRHELYCSIAEALQCTGAVHGGSSADLLGRLGAVLEAEACLSCIDRDTADVPPEISSAGAGSRSVPVAARQQHTPQHRSNSSSSSNRSLPGPAASALQQLKDELTTRVHQSIQQQQQQHKLRHGKFLSSSSLLADLRAAQRANTDLQEQLEAVQTAAAHQRRQCEQDVRKYRRAAEQAALLAEAANSRLLDAQQQLADHSQADALRQTQQLAEQAKCTVKLGVELRQVKQQMAQLELSILQPLLRWQHEQQQQQQQQQQEAAANMSSSHASSNDSCSKRRSSKQQQWQAPAAVTPDVVAAAAAAVEQLLLQQAQQGQQQEVQSSQDALLRHSCHRQQRLQDKAAALQAELQDMRADLEAAQQEASTAHARAEQLQRQLDASTTRHSRVEQQHEQELAAAAQQAAVAAAGDGQQQVLQLHQQINELVSELACAQGEAATAQRQVARLQDEQQQSAAGIEERLRQLQQAADGRLSQEAAAARVAVEQELRLQHAQALAAAQADGQRALEAAQQAWREQRAVLEKQHLQALLRSKQVQEQERQQWQKERDELVQQLTAQYTATGLQMHMEAREQQQELQQQVQQLQQERDALLQQQPQALTGSMGFQQQQQQQHFRHSWQQPNGITGSAVLGGVPQHQSVAGSGSEPAAFALQFSRALQTADADRSAAVRRAVEAEQAAASLHAQLQQQEQELQHLRRALAELRTAWEAESTAAIAAEASAAAGSAALQEQACQVRQLQQRLEEAGRRHQYELRALRQSMAEQLKVVQDDARAELEAAQTRLQLVRLKQQRVVSSMLGADAA